MLVLGISGGIDLIHTREIGICHDSAAVLLDDGKVVAAIEEERLNRIKHTNKFPTNAIKACLRIAGARVGDLDRLAVNFTEDSGRADLVSMLLRGRPVSTLLGLDASVDTSPRALLRCLLEHELGETLPEERFAFVRHHLTHAMSAFVPSGFERALVVTMDGQGEDESGYVATADERGIEVLSTTPVRDSIGLLYTHITLFLGFKHHDEYKVMGLAPYGDPSVYRGAFKELYTLTPEGTYTIHNDRLITFVAEMKPRRRGDPFEQRHKDIAASLQESVEAIAFHVLEHYRRATGMTSLCIAGGVGHNCTLNGKILGSKLFSRVFVQPASHDAGCALGAALGADGQRAKQTARPSANAGKTMPHLFTGLDVGDARAIETKLARWTSLVSFRRSERVADDAASLLAARSVIGWVQGRSEFGPRALGNRSILADPRPPENKEIINAMVKKREGFRPFAPAVLLERARELFDLPEGAEADLGHMTYVLGVRPDKRTLLGAVTHVDGSARVQTVDRAVNPRFWDVIHAFGERTGVPVLLNTSFNNNAEPIVDSVDDAVVCFLTTNLNHLVVGDFIVEKRDVTYERCRSLALALCPHVSLDRARRGATEQDAAPRARLFLATSSDDRVVPVSGALYQVLDASDGHKTIASIVGELALRGEEIFAELLELWASRLVTLLPPAASLSASHEEPVT